MKNEIRKRKKERKKEKEKKKKKEEKKNLRAQETLTSLGPVFVIGSWSISPSTPRAVARSGASGGGGCVGHCRCRVVGGFGVWGRDVAVIVSARPVNKP